MTTCKNCSQQFTLTNEDRELIAKSAPAIKNQTYQIPNPTLCPDCRQQRRLSHRNEQSLHKRTCDLTGKSIISIYPPESPYTVYDQESWWSDKWDALDYGRDFDFSRPFFEQFAELQRQVPRMNLMQSQNENSEYTNCVSHLKDCYLLFSSDYNRDCYYGTWIEESKDCVDNLILTNCELTHNSIFGRDLFNCTFTFYSSNCSDSAFLFDCRGCRNCLMCYGLRNKEYCINNKQYTKEEFEQKKAQLNLGSHEQYQKAKQHFLNTTQNAIYPELRKNGRLENSTGDLLGDCENCHECYEVVAAKDCRYVQGAWRIKDAIDCCYVNGEQGYENCECFPMPTRSAFNLNSYTGGDLYYCDFCMNNCTNCFGCIGLKQKKYCILNKQYTQEEYEVLVPKIIEHMKSTGEWGEFFPSSLSPFPYEKSEANVYFPSNKPEETTNPDTSNSIPADQLPDNIQDANNEICEKSIICQKSGKPFKIIPHELKFYQTHNLPLPRIAPAERHKERLQFKNPRHLQTRQCSKCQQDIQTTCSPKNIKTVYCQKCYLETLG